MESQLCENYLWENTFNLRDGPVKIHPHILQEYDFGRNIVYYIFKYSLVYVYMYTLLSIIQKIEYLFGILYILFVTSYRKHRGTTMIDNSLTLY